MIPMENNIFHMIPMENNITKSELQEKKNEK